MSREFNHPDLENPPYCKAVIEYEEDGEVKSEVVKGFLFIKHLYPDEHPNRVSVVYSEHQDWMPEDVEWLGDQPEWSDEMHELIFHDARVAEVLFEEEWEYEVEEIPSGRD